MSRPTGAAVTQPLSTDERAELERLRALVAAQATADPTDPATPAGTAGGGPRSTRGRWAGSIVLMLLAALIAPLSASGGGCHRHPARGPHVVRRSPVQCRARVHL